MHQIPVCHIITFHLGIDSYVLLRETGGNRERQGGRQKEGGRQRRREARREKEKRVDM